MHVGLSVSACTCTYMYIASNYMIPLCVWARCGLLQFLAEFAEVSEVGVVEQLVVDGLGQRASSISSQGRLYSSTTKVSSACTLCVCVWQCSYVRIYIMHCQSQNLCARYLLCIVSHLICYHNTANVYTAFCFVIVCTMSKLICQLSYIYNCVLLSHARPASPRRKAGCPRLAPTTRYYLPPLPACQGTPPTLQLPLERVCSRVPSESQQ